MAMEKFDWVQNKGRLREFILLWPCPQLDISFDSREQEVENKNMKKIRKKKKLNNISAAIRNSYEYCKDNKEKELCGAARHIVCYPDQVEMGGELLGLYPMTTKLKNTVLYWHNHCRNQIASGEDTYNDRGKYPKAVRMRELVWDNELAYMAHVHASRCHMQHDHCHNTVRFPRCGQNLCYAAGNSNRTATAFIKKCVLFWYDEKDLVGDGPVAIDHFGEGNVSEAGHFTVMINEQVSRVGCAIAYCTDCSGGTFKHCYYITCNYDFTNMVGMRIYMQGSSTASQCSHWNNSRPSKEFDNLCTNAGDNMPQLDY